MYFDTIPLSNSRSPKTAFLFDLRTVIFLKNNDVLINKYIVYILLGISPASNCSWPGQLQFDAGEIPKRIYTIFKSWRKFEIWNLDIGVLGYIGVL